MSKEIVSKMKGILDELKDYKHKNVKNRVEQLNELVDQIRFVEENEQSAPFTFEGIDPVIELQQAVNSLLNSKKHYEASGEYIMKQERITQDLLHKIELEPLSDEESLQVNALLKQTRKDRRVAKDFNEFMKPLHDLVYGNYAFVQRLKELDTKSKRLVQHKLNRTYRPRELQHIEPIPPQTVIKTEETEEIEPITPTHKLSTAMEQALKKALGKGRSL